MNKEQYAEFHKFLAILKFEVMEILASDNISDYTRKYYNNVIKAIDVITKCFIYDGEEK